MGRTGNMPWPAPYATADIDKNIFCSSCGWPVIGVAVNGPFYDWVRGRFGIHQPPDYWAYCSNKDCFNHLGEGVGQKRPKWVKEV